MSRAENDILVKHFFAGKSLGTFWVNANKIDHQRFGASEIFCDSWGKGIGRKILRAGFGGSDCRKEIMERD
jgi:hypothetical protein